MQTTRGTPLNGPQPSGPGAGDTVWRRRRMAILLGVAVLIWAADLVTKTVVLATLPGNPPVRLLGGLLTLRLTRNSGAAFGLATGYTVILSLLALGVVIVVIRLARRLASTGWAVALGLLLGGAAGNLTDRIFRDPAPLRGHVVDFLQLPHWPIFNVADSSITVAAVLIVVLSMMGRRLEDPAGARSARPQGPSSR